MTKTRNALGRTYGKPVHRAEARERLARMRDGKAATSGPRTIVEARVGPASLVLRREGGPLVEVRPGRVQLVEHGDLTLDYAVVVEVDEGDEARPAVRVAEVTARSRSGGRGVSARAVAAEVARVKVRAVLELTQAYGEAPATAAEVRAALKLGSRGPRPDLERYREVAKVARRAAKAGRPTGPAVRDHFGLATAGNARQLIRRARRAGLDCG